MKTYRKQLIHWLFEISKTIYTRIFKHHEPWGITTNQLLQLPEASFGRHLGEFLNQHGFELIPKVERHDCYHVLTGYGITVENEIALQYLSFGNGKQSPYMYGAILLGTLILPDYLSYYLDSYTIGKKANTFHNLDFKKLLNIDLTILQGAFFLRSHSPIKNI
ncbi:Coq4 family protein [Mangrovimonas xylaniphaga]|uniref:Coq4 family protein n=1 Tax=Mangrovimonas xylaniphaga TaxID=1645915 RepID=UPI0006B5F5F6|nr:Coq4 family protein [Mangrovimonas xylaniphaga]